MFIHAMALKSIVQPMVGLMSISRGNSNSLRSVAKVSFGSLVMSPRSGSCRLDAWSGLLIAPETGLESYRWETYWKLSDRIMAGMQGIIGRDLDYEIAFNISDAAIHHTPYYMGSTLA